MQTIHASKTEFKGKALEFFGLIESSGHIVVITDHCKPTLEIRPYGNLERNPLDILRSSVISYKKPFDPIEVECVAPL